MANKKLFFGILVLLLVFGIVVVGCNNDDGSTSGNSTGIFSLTGIPSEYNGKYAMFFEETFNGLIGAQSIDFSSRLITMVPISSGKVTIPMWIANSSGTGVVSFTGDRVTEEYKSGVLIYGKKTTDMSDEPIVTFIFRTVIFVNGSATKTWNDGWIQ